MNPHFTGWMITAITFSKEPVAQLFFFPSPLPNNTNNCYYGNSNNRLAPNFLFQCLCHIKAEDNLAAANIYKSQWEVILRALPSCCCRITSIKSCLTASGYCWARQDTYGWDLIYTTDRTVLIQAKKNHNHMLCLLIERLGELVYTHTNSICKERHKSILHSIQTFSLAWNEAIPSTGHCVHA